MADSIEDIIKFWEGDRPIYEEIGKYVKEILQEKLYDKGIHIEIGFRTKEIVSLLKKLKSKSDSKPYSYSDLTDKLGIRIICNYKEDLQVADAVIREQFEVKKFEDKAEGLADNVFSYTSFHYDIQLRDTAPENLRNRVFELQLRTINQHAWACTAHELSYKADIKLPKELLRKVFRLSALYEIADGELSFLNNFVLSHQDFRTYKLIKKLEVPYYQTAKEQYNRNQSFLFIQKILDNNLFTDNEWTALETFIDQNKEKFKDIFSQYKNSPHIRYVILQPEIILAWFLREKKEFKLKEFWNENFDADEYETVENTWGVIED